MSLGFFIWLIVAIGIGGFTWWSIRVQMLQKKAWKAFADKFGLDFEGGKTFDRPSFDGYFEGIYVRAYEGDELDRGGRVKKAILVEAELGHILPFNLVITKKSEQAIFRQLMQQLGIKNRPKLKSKVWDPQNLVGVDDEETMTRWLNVDRLAALQKVLSIPNAKTVFLSNDEAALFALQIENPMLNPRLLVKLFKRLKESLSILQIPGMIEDTPPEVEQGEDDGYINFDEPEEEKAATVASEKDVSEEVEKENKEVQKQEG